MASRQMSTSRTAGFAVASLVCCGLGTLEVSALRLDAEGTRSVRAKARAIDVDFAGDDNQTMYSSSDFGFMGIRESAPGDSPLDTWFAASTSQNASMFPVPPLTQLGFVPSFGNESRVSNSVGAAQEAPVAIAGGSDMKATATPVNSDFPDPALSNSATAQASGTNASVASGSDHLRHQLIVAKYDEDVSWLKALPPGMDVAVYQSKDPKGPHFVENFGNEASKYLSYILDNYDDLPDFMTFVQAGRQDWHDPLPKDVTLTRWNWDMAAEHGGMAYLPTAAPCLVEDTVELPVGQALGGAREVQRQRPQCLGVTEHHPKQMTTLREVWDDVFGQELGPLPHRWVATCCAQFELTREAVQRHPEDFYRRLFDWVMEHDRSLMESDTDGSMRRNHDPERRDAGHVMEVAWVLLFADGDEILPNLGSTSAD